jgi:hypothetical protein
LNILQFEFSRLSHAVLRAAKLRKKRENGPEIPAFRVFGFVSGVRLAELKVESPKVSGLLREYSRDF